MTLRTFSLLSPFVVICFLMASVGCAESSRQSDDSVSINSGGNQLQLFAHDLSGATLVGDVSIVFRDGAHLRVESLLKHDLGYDLDIREYPSYLLGLRDLDDVKTLSDSEARDILDARRFLLQQGSRDALEFATSNGVGYAVLGEEDHFIFLVDADNSEAITQIFVAGLSRSDVRERVMRGVR